MILTTTASEGYELLDSGNEEKLERYGTFVLCRPDPQALWAKTADGSSPGAQALREKWKKAHARYVRKGKEGEWQGSSLPKKWQIGFGGLRFLIKPTSFKHTGLFPEQLPNWEWMQAQIARGLSQTGRGLDAERRISVLNLFGYTGGGTLAAASAGASVTHVDASKTAVAWARENAALSGLEKKSVRWITEDVLVYIRREIKRGSRYDAIIMDPPAFGHGPKDELWKIEEHFLPLMKLCGELLSDRPLFILMSGYAAGYSSLMFKHNLSSFAEKYGGIIEHGELTIEESGEGGRLLPAGIFGRWTTLK